MARRQDILDGTEVMGGYSRAVRLGNQVHVSGTTSRNTAGEVVGGDVYAQSKEVYAKIARVLAEAGAGLSDVVRIVAYVTDISGAEGFGRATAEAFAPSGVGPAATLVEVSALVAPEMLVEIEAYALLAET